MISKIITLNAIFVVANAGLLFHEPAVSSQNIVRHDEASLLHKAAPVAHYTVSVGRHVLPAVHHGTHHGYSHPAYDFSYSVSDSHTGDYKSHHESRIGDTVRGFYSLIQPDGSIRKVHYSADGHTGFKAIVRNTVPILGHSYHQY